MGCVWGSLVVKPESYKLTKEGEEWEVNGNNDGQGKRGGQELVGGEERNGSPNV